MNDTFKTIKDSAYGEVSVKGSKFLCYIYPAEDEIEAENRLNGLKSKYHDATHHCYAYILSEGTERRTRFNDDGEPSGSAGRPILSVIEGRELTNLICIVVRYFGGTKLGVGGLVRAYSDAAKEALDECRIIVIQKKTDLVLSFPYSLTGSVERLITENNAGIVERKFSEIPEIICSVRDSFVDSFMAKFIDISHGQGKIKRLEKD